MNLIVTIQKHTTFFFPKISSFPLVVDKEFVSLCIALIEDYTIWTM